jgi:UDP-3-O-[3-hydroxymyristoyl] glucosamine N-acyltransferase
MRLGDLAKVLGCELRGDATVEIARVAPIDVAGPGDLTFLANPRYTRHLATTKASAVILAVQAPDVPLPSLRTDDPYLAFAAAVECFHRTPATEPEIHSSAVIAPSAAVGARASIGAHTVIGDGVRIGDDARIGPHVVIDSEVSIGHRFIAHAHVTVRERVRIGDDVVLQSGAVVGSDGFGYVPTAEGGVRKLIQAGDVVLEDGVEIGANTTIDRAAIGSTVIRRGAKIDNLVMIAHGCEVGENSVVAAQVGLSGSTRIGRRVRIGGQVGTAGHLSVGDGAQVAAQSGIPNSVPAGAVVGGYPAIEMRLWRRVTSAVVRLPDLLRRVRRIEKRLGMERPHGGQS